MSTSTPTAIGLREPLPDLRPFRSTPGLAWTLALLFAASGCAGLVFENLWFRQLGLVLGHGVWASGIVLASFMCGLAVGNALAARWGDSGRRPLLAFAAAELAVSVAGAALVLALPSLAGWLAPAQRLLEAQPFAVNALRLAISFLLLSIPTSAMGLTLPLLVVAVTRQLEHLGPTLARLYGCNTLGAVVGCLLVETVLVPRLGIRGSGLLAAGLDLAVAATALALSRRSRQPGDLARAPAGAAVTNCGGSAAGRILGAGFLTGAMLLALEVVWFRFMLLFAAATAASFALMLALVLAGIGLGGLVVSLWLSRWPLARHYLRALMFACGFCTLLSYVLFEPALGSWSSNSGRVASNVLPIAAPLLLPTSLLSGMLFTLLGAALAPGSAGNARAAGQLTFANTVGAMTGSLLAAFVLLPWLGVEGTLVAAAAGYGLAGLLAPGPRGGRGQQWATRIAAAAFVLLLGLFPHGTMWRHLAASFARVARGDAVHVAAVREGLAETSAYLDHLHQGEFAYRRLVTNGFSMSTTQARARRYMKLYVYVPVALHPGPRRALLISYGVGSTAKALTDTRELEAIHIVDTSRDIVELSLMNFAPAASWPPADPRVRLHIEDGRQFLLTTAERFDLITAEPPPPKLAGVSSLYSLEYFRLVRERLTPGGFVTYWLPLHEIALQDFMVLTATFCRAFEDCSLWAGADADWMLMGSREARGPGSAERVLRQWLDPRIAPELERVGLENPGRLGALFIADASDLVSMTAGVAPLDDDHPGRLLPVDRVHGGRLYLDLLDRAPQAFERSPLMTRLWPQALRSDVVREYRERRLEEDLYWGTLVPGRRVHALPEAYRLLAETRLRDLPFRLLGGDPDLRDVAELRARRGDAPAWVAEQVAIAALAARDFARGRDLARQARATNPASAKAWQLEVLALCLMGQRDAAAATLAASPSHSLERDDREFLTRTLGRCTAAPSGVDRIGPPGIENAVQ